MGKIGIPELFILFVIPLIYTIVVYIVGKKIGYGKALRDVADGKIPALLNSQKPNPN